MGGKKGHKNHCLLFYAGPLTPKKEPGLGRRKLPRLFSGVPSFPLPKKNITQFNEH
jgi:hypothetical protein